MKVLVTGGAGFIGTRLVQLLHSNGAEVFVLDAKTRVAQGWDTCEDLIGKKRMIKGKVQNPKTVERVFDKNRFDVCFHLAAQSHVDQSIGRPLETIETNVVGTQNIAMACSRHDVPLLYCSTDEVYGDVVGRKRRSREVDAMKPSSPYSASKAAGEMLVRSVSRTFGLTFAITRGTNAFGANQFPEKLVPITCRMLKQGKRVPIHGNGQQIRQWIHVDEFAQFMIKVGTGLVTGDKRAVNETYNIAGPVKLGVAALVAKFAEHLGIDEEDAMDFVPNRPGGDHEYSVDGTKAFRRYGFNAQRSICDPAEIALLIESYSAEGHCDVALYGETA